MKFDLLFSNRKLAYRISSFQPARFLEMTQHVLFSVTEVTTGGGKTLTV